jgi:hypothetical protein
MLQYRFYTVLLCALVLFFGGCAKKQQPDHYGEPSSAEMDRVFLDAAGNAPEILRALRSYPSGSEGRKAAGFLIRHLPPADAALMGAEDIKEHVDYALKARAEFPWCRDLPEDIFLHYVLPHRVAQELHVPWRKAFYEELAPLVAEHVNATASNGSAQNMREAARLVNAWCFEQADFVGTDRWDQDPMATITRGIGRCEELAILFIAAARSVGIPARTALVPLWRHNSSNHLWVEVWDKGEWHALGAGEIESDYGLAWFMKDMPTAAFVQATAYGRYPDGNNESFRMKPGFTIINRSAEYTKTGVLKVQVRNAGKPVPEAKVFVNLFNGGGLRPFASIPCDASGNGTLRLGGGHYLLTVADKKGGRDADTVQVLLGRETTLTLDISRNRIPNGVYTMHFPFDAEKKAAAAEAFDAANSLAEAKKKAVRDRRKAETQKLKDKAEQQFPDAPKLVAAVASAGKNAPELLRALARSPESMRLTVAQLISDMHPKDRILVKADDLLEQVRLALEARERLASLGFSYDDDMFRQMVLPLRFRFEQYLPYRKAYFTRYAHYLDKMPVEDVLRLINSDARDLPLSEPRVGFGPAVPPAALLQVGHVTAPIEKALYVAAALRSIGVPARMLRDYDFVEFYDGEKLRPLYPDAPENFADAKADEGVGMWYEEPAEVELRLLQQGKARVPAAGDYYTKYSLNRLTPRGTFRSLENINLRLDAASNSTVLTVPAGEVFFIMGRREKDRAHFEVERLELLPGERRKLTKDVGALGVPPQADEAEE